MTQREVQTGVKPARNKKPHPVPTGTITGWTFWSAAATCWFKFALRYILGLQGPTKPHFTLGSTYHALLEGVPEKDICAWGSEYAAALPEAKRLYAARLSGPPMGEVLHKERTLEVPGTSMTSKPDREEAGHLREFKTGSWFGKYDAEGWAVNGAVIGELMASGLKQGVVDVINKSTLKTELYPVGITSRKAAALTALVNDLEDQIRQRVKAARAAELPTLFPRNLTNCVGRFGPCDYYGKCWGSVLDGMRYPVAPVSSWWERLEIPKQAVDNARNLLKEYDHE